MVKSLGISASGFNKRRVFSLLSAIFLILLSQTLNLSVFGWAFGVSVKLFVKGYREL